MEVVIRPTAERAARLVARLVADALRDNPTLVLGLATGATMEPVYAELARLHREERLDFSHCTTFNLDEYIGLAPEDPRSYHAVMREALFRHVNLGGAATHLPDGMATDVASACARYEQRIRACGGIDLQLLGIGQSGHIGFNEPLSALRSRTREKALSPVTLAQNARYFGGDPARVPRRAITMGVGTILEARRCVALVTGAHKAAILARAVEGPLGAMVSASALQLHPSCVVVSDEAAASQLSGTDYYRWTFAHEPEWQAYQDA